MNLEFSEHLISTSMCYYYRQHRVWLLYGVLLLFYIKSEGERSCSLLIQKKYNSTNTLGQRHSIKTLRAEMFILHADQAQDQAVCEMRTEIQWNNYP